MDLEQLKKPFAYGLISWRVGATNQDKSKGIALAYIDARDVMQRLDDVCGPMNWRCSHPIANGKTSCRIEIWDDQKKDWVWKENGCGDSAVEAEKGAFSDSLKRAAVVWGVGRYLYDVPNIWVDLENKKIKNPNDPRLKKALEQAARGIRSESEAEPQVIPFSDEECNLLVGRIKEATIKTLADEKNNARAAWPRMSEKHRKLVTEKIEKREAELIPMAAE